MSNVQSRVQAPLYAPLPERIGMAPWAWDLLMAGLRSLAVIGGSIAIGLALHPKQARRQQAASVPPAAVAARVAVMDSLRPRCRRSSHRSAIASSTSPNSFVRASGLIRTAAPRFASCMGTISSGAEGGRSTRFRPPNSGSNFAPSLTRSASRLSRKGKTSWSRGGVRCVGWGWRWRPDRQADAKPDALKRGRRSERP